MDPGTGRSIGRAYVTMATPEVATSALALHSHHLDGRYITVTEARPVEAQPAGQIGQGFEAYKSPDQSQHNSRPNHRHQRNNAGRGKNQNRRRFSPNR